MKNVIKVFKNSKFKNVNGFIVANFEANKALIIDTAFDLVDDMTNYIKENNLEVEGIIITHGHFDHFVGLDELCDNFPETNVYITLDDLPNLFDPVLNFSTIYDTVFGSYTVKQPNKLKALIYNNSYDLGGIKFKVLPERGHSKGSVMLDFYEDQIIFSGEILQGDRADRVLPEIAEKMAVVEQNIRFIFENYDTKYNLYPSHQAIDLNLGDIIKYNIRVQRILAMK